MVLRLLTVPECRAKGRGATFKPRIPGCPILACPDVGRARFASVVIGNPLWRLDRAISLLSIQAKKKGRSRQRRIRPLLKSQRQLQRGYVRSLQALGAAGHFEFNRLAFVERLVPLRRDGGKVDEHILARLALNESESLRCVKPLHCSLFFHL